MVIRNLHAHNCHGVVISWARLHQKGVSHINNHRRRYVRSIFEGLGYYMNEELLLAFRRSDTKRYFQYWLRNNIMVFQRHHPLTSQSCRR